MQRLIDRQGPDLIQAMMRTPEREKQISFSKDYITTARAIFTRKDAPFVSRMEDLADRTVAIPSGTVVQQEIARKYPDIRLLLLSSDADCLTAVSTGSADAYIGNLTLGSYLIVSLGMSNMKVAAPTSLDDHIFSFGSRKDWPELSSIINKGLATITSQEKLAIFNKYLSVRYEHGISTKSIFKWALTVAGGIIVIIFLFVLWNTTLAAKVKARTLALEESNDSLNAEIEAHKRADTQFRRSEARFKATFEQAAVGIAHVSKSGRFLRLNRKFCKIIGYSRPEIMGMTFQEITHPDDLDKGLQQMQCLLRGEIRTYCLEKRYIRKDGRIVWTNLTVSLVRDGAGVPRWFVSVIEDISVRKRVEEQLQFYQLRLKALATQLTVIEEQERRRIAADLHDNISQGLALARVQLVAVKNETADARLIEKLNDVSQTLLKAIADSRHLIFDLSSPTMNEIGLTAAISEWMEEKIGKRYGLEFELVTKGLKKRLDDDSRAILFRNVRELLTNVIKHASARKVQVFIRHGDTCLKICVADDGVGFDPTTVMQPLNSAIGFGLFSIQERMTDLGGTLEIDSEPGKGCRMTLSVPRRTQEFW